MRCLIVDDERLARSELKRLLSKHPDLEVVGEAAEAEAARRAIAESRPDLLFLDIHMPGEDGFQLLESLDSAPAVIFTTAHDEHAIRAFEVNALDYLLKPLEEDRLAAALDKARSQSASTDPQRPLTLESRFFIKDGDRCWFVKLAEVRLFESEGNYSRVFFQNERPLVCRSLRYLEERLDKERFFRASRRHIVGLRWIRSVQPLPGGGLKIRLEGGPEVDMSRRGARLFRQTMGL